MTQHFFSGWLRRSWVYFFPLIVKWKGRHFFLFQKKRKQRAGFFWGGGRRNCQKLACSYYGKKIACVQGQKRGGGRKKLPSCRTLISNPTSRYVTFFRNVTTCLILLRNNFTGLFLSRVLRDIDKHATCHLCLGNETKLTHMAVTNRLVSSRYVVA